MSWRSCEETEVKFETVGDVLEELDRINATMDRLCDDNHRDIEIARLLRNYRRVIENLPLKEV